MNLPQQAVDHLNAQLAALKPELRKIATDAIQLELERAAGVDVTIGEAALKASAASIALEQAVHIEKTALRMILAAVVAAPA